MKILLTQNTQISCNAVLNSFVIDTGLSDFNKMTVTVLTSYFQEVEPKIIMYWDYKKFFQIMNLDLLLTQNMKVTEFQRYFLLGLLQLTKSVRLREKSWISRNFVNYRKPYG